MLLVLQNILTRLERLEATDNDAFRHTNNLNLKDLRIVAVWNAFGLLNKLEEF